MPGVSKFSVKVLLAGVPGGPAGTSDKIPELAKLVPSYVYAGAPGALVGKADWGFNIKSVEPPPGIGISKPGIGAPPRNETV